MPRNRRVIVAKGDSFKVPKRARLVDVEYFYRHNQSMARITVEDLTWLDRLWLWVRRLWT